MRSIVGVIAYCVCLMLVIIVEYGVIFGGKSFKPWPYIYGILICMVIATADRAIEKFILMLGKKKGK